MDEKRPLLVCDFDGTLLTQDSELAMVQYFRRTGRLGILQYLAAAAALLPNTVCTKLERPRLVRAWCAFHSPAAQRRMIDDFLMHGTQGLQINPAVLRIVQSFDGEKLLLTGSDERMVRGLLEKLGLENLFDAVIGAKVSRYGLRLLCHPYGKGKLQFIPRRAAVGIGDSLPDRFFLSQCDTAYVTARKPEMLAEAKKNGWILLDAALKTER